MAHQEPHHSHSTPLSTTDPDTNPQQQDPAPLAAYIRHITDTAPRPNRAQLERLAGLLRDPDNPSTN